MTTFKSCRCLFSLWCIKSSCSSCCCKHRCAVVNLHILRDSGTSTGALAFLLVLQSSRWHLAPGLSFGLAGGAAGGVSTLSAAGTGQNQLTAELGGAQLVLVPGTVAVPAVWTDTGIFTTTGCLFRVSAGIPKFISIPMKLGRNKAETIEDKGFWRFINIYIWSQVTLRLSILKQFKTMRFKGLHCTQTDWTTFNTS